jgi:hypothetical protein
VIQCFVAIQGSLYEDFEVILNFGLPNVIGNPAGAYIGLEGCFIVDLLWCYDSVIAHNSNPK